jgi:hypothetical protein
MDRYDAMVSPQGWMLTTVQEECKSHVLAVATGWSAVPVRHCPSEGLG